MKTNSQILAVAPPNRAASDQAPTAPRVAENVTDTANRIAISIIIPVRNDPENLEHCLRSLDASEYSDYEIIVVDDASTDDTPEVARRHDVRLLRQATRSGPAAARNRGAEAADHPYLFFVDADVCVQPGTLGHVAARFRDAPSVDAFFGSYDASPGATDFLSQYRNLLHHWVHQDGRKNASSFWSGCGAIKRSVFFDLGGFDTGFTAASVEDIELGARLRQAGHRVELDKSLQVKHMKRWTLWLMIRTDIRQRGVPWTRLLLRQGKIPNDLNLRYSQRLSALLALAVPVALILALWLRDSWKLWSLLALGFLAGVVLLNRRFYRFLSRAKSPLFAALVIPLHILYFLYSSLAFAAGWLSHLWHERLRNPPDPR